MEGKCSTSPVSQNSSRQHNVGHKVCSRYLTKGRVVEQSKLNSNYKVENLRKVIRKGKPIELGSGDASAVFLVKSKTTKLFYALKEVNKSKTSEANLKNESTLHLKLKHNHIIEMYSISEDLENLNFVLEFAEGGTLSDQFTEKKQFSEKEVFDVFIQLLDALAFLHSKNIVHNGIEPDNVLFTGDKIKLTDFSKASLPEDSALLKSDVVSLGKLMLKMMTMKQEGEPKELIKELEKTGRFSGYCLEMCANIVEGRIENALSCFSCNWVIAMEESYHEVESLNDLGKGTIKSVNHKFKETKQRMSLLECSEMNDISVIEKFKEEDKC